MANLLGIDVGSTTVKVAVLSEEKEILYTSYERHFARVKECVLAQLAVVKEKFGGDFRISITGSAGLGLAERSGVSFVQEVQAAFTRYESITPTRTRLSSSAARTQRSSLSRAAPNSA